MLPKTIAASGSDGNRRVSGHAAAACEVVRGMDEENYARGAGRAVRMSPAQRLQWRSALHFDSVDRPEARRHELHRMPLRVPHVHTLSAARPAHSALDLDARPLQLLHPCIEC